ncbi:hypothetical protein E2C01_092772 [Portunus trituberculatus]|uniref:Uncharacterized protein n=1 Tax=Portunus trituberculatus TaxID=210409 RepID=A0A5B7JSB3_PORTR|nr:hypothetical protein [Portunus trituberculatus]
MMIRNRCNVRKAARQPAVRRVHRRLDAAEYGTPNVGAYLAALLVLYP